jgi:surface antigen
MQGRVGLLAVILALVAPASAGAGMQCTTWAHLKRPDLPWTELGDARTWARRAAALGFPVTGTPQRGDVAVWGRGQCTRNDGHGCAGRAGHVAYVTAVGRRGRIGITEANWPTGAGVRRAEINPGGLAFIHLRN